MSENLQPQHSFSTKNSWMNSISGYSIERWNDLVSDTDLHVAKSMLDAYILNLKELYAVLRNLNLVNDKNSILRAAHKLSSTSEILGFIALASELRALQKMLKQQNLETDAEALYKQILDSITQILQSIPNK